MKDKLGKTALILSCILALGLAFRLVNFERSFFFAHDQDLYSWIAKDILVNHHQRLVGQLTSVDGVFIGSFYYYLIAVFYGLFKMNPMSAVVPTTVIGLFSILSIFYICKKHFGIKTGLIAGFLYAVSFGIARFDRWSVPTLPTLLWSIWFVDVILEMLRGNLRYLPLYGILSGFVWQLHIALLPILPVPILAFFVGGYKIEMLWSKKWIKTVILSIVGFVLVFSPFLIFEVKHNFSQVKSIIESTKKDIGAPSGKMKLFKVVEASGIEFQQRIMFGWKNNYSALYWLGLLLMVGWNYKNKSISNNQMGLFGVWYVLILLAQFSSKRVVSEYYFTNLLPIYLILLASSLSNIPSIKIIGAILGGYLVVNVFWLITRTDEDQSYLYRRQVVEYIKSDVVMNRYPCVAITFIADPGVGVGFRYLSWYYGLNLVKPGSKGVPVYNVSIPWQLSQSENPIHFGRFGVLLPQKIDKLIEKSECGNSSIQLDPLLGYTD